MSAKTIKKPKGSILANLSAISVGSMPINTREPSKGGIGIRLKTPKTTLINIKLLMIKLIPGDNAKNLSGMLNMLNKKAKIKFAMGPANPIHIISVLGFFKLQ
jgi:hypothetical protein